MNLKKLLSGGFASQRDKGKAGEKLARQYLEKRGMTILCENFCAKGGEIDLIGTLTGILVFVEVKVRKNTSYGEGVLAVTKVKRQRLYHASQIFMLKHKLPSNTVVRFDIVSIDKFSDKDDWKISHFENVITIENI